MIWDLRFCLYDDLIGRTLDAIHKFGSTELFNEITLQAMKQFSLGTQLIRIYTTNFRVYGKYESDAPDSTDSIKITFGHAKDGRTDLKRFVLGLVTNQHSLPLFSKRSWKRIGQEKHYEHDQKTATGN